MRSIILSIGLVLVVAMSISCDENNNVIAQDMDPGPTAPSDMTTVKGTVIATDGQCSGTVDGFDNGDSVTVTLINSEEEPTGKIDNNTKETSAECSTASGVGVITDSPPPLSAMVCETANSTIPGLSDGDFMSMLISFSWLDAFIDNVDKTVAIVKGDIGAMPNTQNLPCARVKIENITASN